MKLLGFMPLGFIRGRVRGVGHGCLTTRPKGALHSKAEIRGGDEVNRILCRAKIHRATLSEANLNYVGSITIPADLMKTLDIYESEQCDVLNVNNGARFTTYAIAGDRQGHFCLNGAAARLGEPGDVIIVMFYAVMTGKEAFEHRIKIAVMDGDNQVERLLFDDE